MSDNPEFTRESQLVEQAYELAVDAHHGARRRNDTNIDHPAAVGELLHEQGYPPEVVAAGLLHDVLEDTDTDPEEIAAMLGPEVGELVEVMTENASIEPYEARKAAHRRRVAAHSPQVAAIYAADKLAKTRMRQTGAGDTVSEEKRRHYWATLEELREAHPQLPFLDELEAGLRALDVERSHAGRR